MESEGRGGKGKSLNGSQSQRSRPKGLEELDIFLSCSPTGTIDMFVELVKE